jgi:branched-chain amino acid transport system ATP-binding protein
MMNGNQMDELNSQNTSNAKAVDLVSEEKKEIDAKRLGIALKVENISKSYGGVKALDNVSISLDAGERIGLIGNRGSGKSTILDAISGLISSDSGRIFIKSKNVSSMSIAKRSRLGLRRVFQTPIIFDELTLEENIIIGSPPSQGEGILASLFMPTMVKKERHKTARDLMQYCDIEPTKGKNLSRLPFSVKKKIELARALMGNPRILILDEPAAGLDEDDKSKYAQVVSDYCDTFSTTLILVEHDIDFIKSLCKRAVAIDAGKVMADGEVVAVLHNKEVKNAYLGES